MPQAVRCHKLENLRGCAHAELDKREQQAFVPQGWITEPTHRHGGGRLRAHGAAVVNPLAQRLREAAAAQRLRLLRTQPAEKPPPSSCVASASH